MVFQESAAYHSHVDHKPSTSTNELPSLRRSPRKHTCTSTAANVAESRMEYTCIPDTMDYSPAPFPGFSPPAFSQTFQDIPTPQYTATPLPNIPSAAAGSPLQPAGPVQGMSFAFSTPIAQKTLDEDCNTVCIISLKDDTFFHAEILLVFTFMTNI